MRRQDWSRAWGPGAGVRRRDRTAGAVYERFAMFTGKAVGVWYSATLFLLPRQLQDKFAVAVNGLVDKLLTYRHGAAEASS